MGKGDNKWIILIEEKETVVGVLTESGNLLVSKEQGWDGDDPNSLVAALDSGIGSCLAREESIPRPEKTIFILPPLWVSRQSEVLPSRKKILQHACKQLNLVPEGFLVGEEILANFYADFVSVYFGREYLRFSVLKDKSVEIQEELENGEDIDPEDVVVFLRQLNGKAILPDQLIFWGRIGEGNKERLLSYQWHEEKVFNKTPKVKVLMWPDTFQMVAQMVQGEVKLEVVEEKAESEDLDLVEEEDIEDVEEVESDQMEESKISQAGSTFGFTSEDVGEDVSWQMEKEVQQEAEPVLEEKKQPKVVKKPLRERIPRVSLPKIKFPKFSFALLALPFILAAGLFWGWRYSTARVEIYVTPEELSDEIEVILDPGAKTLDVEKGIVPVEEVSVEKSGSKAKKATGEKMIGEKAKGEVNIFNRTSERAEFEAGTSLFGPENLEFVLDNDVSVASKTADLETGVDRWGETTVSVTAGNIGPDYNLAANTTFTVGDYSDEDYLARNPEAMSGGTSREIRVVSETDRQQLKEDLIEDLKSQAEEELKSKLADSKIIEGSFQSTTVEEVFSAEEGAEVEEVSLDLTINLTAAKINHQRLIEIAGKVLGEKTEEGYQLKEESLTAKLDVDENEDGEEKITGKLELKGKVYPEIDVENLKNEIVRKKEMFAKELIRETYPRIYRHEVIYQFPLMKFFGYLPSRPENIIIKVEE